MGKAEKYNNLKNIGKRMLEYIKNFRRYDPITAFSVATAIILFSFFIGVVDLSFKMFFLSISLTIAAIVLAHFIFPFAVVSVRYENNKVHDTTETKDTQKIYLVVDGRELTLNFKKDYPLLQTKVFFLKKGIYKIYVIYDKECIPKEVNLFEDIRVEITIPVKLEKNAKD